MQSAARATFFFHSLLSRCLPFSLPLPFFLLLPFSRCFPLLADDGEFCVRDRRCSGRVSLFLSLSLSSHSSSFIKILSKETVSSVQSSSDDYIDLLSLSILNDTEFHHAHGIIVSSISLTGTCLIARLEIDPDETEPTGLRSDTRCISFCASPFSSSTGTTVPSNSHVQPFESAHVQSSAQQRCIAFINSLSRRQCQHIIDNEQR